MERYVRWWKDGYLSPTGECFDIGNTVRASLARFIRDRDPYAGSTDPGTAGNGSIMRLAPVVLYFHPDAQAVDHHAGDSSRTTHGAPEAVAACRMLAAYLMAALQGAPKDEVLHAVEPQDWMSQPLQDIARGGYLTKDRTDVHGTGYVVASLEAALWCFATTDAFRDAILTAANLGDDADTTAAVCGQVAGAFYGIEGIPAEWLERLYMAREIGELATSLVAAAPTTP